MTKTKRLPPSLNAPGQSAAGPSVKIGTPRSRVKKSSGIFGKAFLARAWEARHGLAPDERRGFAQFFYLTICGHMEAVIADAIRARLKAIELGIRLDGLPPMRYVPPVGAVQQHPVDPLSDSVRRLIAGMESDVASSPLKNLIKLYARVFGRSVSSVLGGDLYPDIEALAVLRNLFAHGRDLIVEFDGDPITQYQGTLDNNDLKFPAQRLYEAGVIADFNITGLNHDDFLGKFFSDDALLHFHRAVRSAEQRIRSACDFLPEQWMHHRHQLPELPA